MVDFDNFFTKTKAYFKAVGCKEEDLKIIKLQERLCVGYDQGPVWAYITITYKGRIPDFVSYSKRSGHLSSAYWYNTDKAGKNYVLRWSDHWMVQKSKEEKVANKVGGVASCRWYLKQPTGSNLVKTYGGHLGKCYLDSFSKIKGK